VSLARKLFVLKLHWQILIALVLAVIAGRLSGLDGAIFGIRLLDVYTFLGTLFMNALKMLIVPLVFSSIITGIAGIGDSGAMGRLGGKTLLYYLATSMLAVLVGLTMVNIVSPGIVDGVPAREVVALSDESVADIADRIEGRGAGDVVDVFIRMVPTNIIAAAAEGRMLGLIFFSLLFGYFMTRVAGAPGQMLRDFWQGVFEVMMLLTDWVMKFAPIGVFALVAKVVASTGFAAFEPLMAFFFTVLAALAIHLLVVLPLLLRVFARVSPGYHFRAMSPALLMAFSTASSSATLPVTMECVEKRAGVSNRTTSFVLPLGATVNMDGTALYECVAAMFIAQAYGLELSLVTQFTVVLIALLTSIGVAGIPAASLVAITIILTSIGLPVEAVGLILAVDRVLDMCRTGVNVFSDSCGAVLIGRFEGETDILATPPDASR
jgi:Na+/H+-dicarboxylate symporter